MNIGPITAITKTDIGGITAMIVTIAAVKALYTRTITRSAFIGIGITMAYTGASDIIKSIIATIGGTLHPDTIDPTITAITDTTDIDIIADAGMSMITLTAGLAAPFSCGKYYATHAIETITLT